MALRRSDLQGLTDVAYDLLELTEVGAVASVIRIEAPDDLAALKIARTRATAHGALVYRGSVRVDRVRGVFR